MYVCGQVRGYLLHLTFSKDCKRFYANRLLKVTTFFVCKNTFMGTLAIMGYNAIHVCSLLNQPVDIILTIFGMNPGNVNSP